MNSNTLLVGELNPFGGDLGYALWPEPPECSGGRLMRILGMTYHDYVRTPRVNLCRGRWRIREARLAAHEITMNYVKWRNVVLLGRKVAEAFGHDRHPAFTEHRGNDNTRVFLLPHPSGLNRAWNEPGAVERARELLKDVLPVGREPEARP